jgi:hypothetical protein
MPPTINPSVLIENEAGWTQVGLDRSKKRKVFWTYVK